MDEMKRVQISAPAIAVRGNDIDTDRIIPARFLKCVTFDGLGSHAFEDDRLQLQAQGKVHPFDKPEFAAARILVVNKNFGCGSSREHAPQAIMRWGNGIQAIVGESFAEIFFGNCVALGVPCLVASEADCHCLQDAIDANPSAEITVDVAAQEVRWAGGSIKATIPDGIRKQFVEGTWDATVELIAAAGEIESTASRLPYFNHWR